MGALKNIRRTKMLAQEGRCYYCGLPMWDDTPNDCPAADCRRNRQPKPLRCTAEHLLPRSEGGADTPENIVAACLFCNQRRHRAKCPKSPEAHRTHVRRRMAAGRWLAAQANTMPTIATTMITSGARENSVQKASAAACSKASRSSQRCAAVLKIWRSVLGGIEKSFRRLAQVFSAGR